MSSKHAREHPDEHGQATESTKFGITVDELFTLNQEKEVSHVQQRGGAEGIAKALKADLFHGVDTSDDGGQQHVTIQDRVNAFGSNVMAEVDAKTFFALVLEQVEDPIIILLIVAATVSTILGLVIKEERDDGGWIDGVAIWVAVFVVAFVGATNDYQKDQQFRKLNAQKEVFDVTVIRDGKEGLIKNSELIVGDVLVLNTGDRVTADGILFHNNDLVIDEASLTGESDTIKKKIDKDPFCRSGTQVTDGSGRILVIAVGEKSEWGQTLALVTGETDETPLQVKLGGLAVAIGKLGFFVGIASFIVLVVRWIVDKDGFPLDEINDEGPIQFFLFAITIVVVAVPEGLPLAVTISLAYSMRKMMKDNNFVRVLSACETMGGATAICSDKTGTLTENKMTVVAGWFHGNYFNETPGADELNPEMKTLITENASLNSKAFLIPDENGKNQFVGNRTECALLEMSQKWGVDYHEVRTNNEQDMVKVYGFSSAKKMASIIVRRGNVLRLYNKGAAEMVLEVCSQFVEETGSRNPINSEKRTELSQTIKEMASQGLRTLAITYTDFEPAEFSFGPKGEPLDESINGLRSFAEAPEENLILMAIVGIKDPVRKEVPDAVQQCKNAGIHVRMVTGDNIFTAQHIARECGILTDGIAMEGPIFRRRAEQDVEELKKELPKLQVLARSSPTDKHTLVSLLRGLGEVVAVTGDGTNDAPALKESDVGLAMGIAGTEVAKEAADIVIMDDNFSSIVKAVLWGRSVFSNIRKFLQFQLTVNVVALVVAFVAAMVGGETPLNVLQLLWVNLIMDTLAALALATENPTPDLLDEKPHGRDEPLLSPTMITHILLQSVYQLVVIFVVLYSFPSIFKRYEFPDKDEFYYEYCHVNEGDHTYEDDPVANYCPDYLNCNNSTMKCKLYSEDELRDQGITNFGFRDHIKDEYEDEHDDAEMRKNSVIFNAFIFMQIFNEINARKIRNEYNIFQGVFDSWIFCGIFVGITGLQLIIMFTPLRDFFKVDELNGWEWLFSLAVGLGVIPYSTIIRFVLRIHETLKTKTPEAPASSVL